VPNDSNNPPPQNESRRLYAWLRELEIRKRENVGIKRLMEGQLDLPPGTSVRYVESLHKVAAAALEVADSRRRVTPSPRTESEFTGAGHALSFYRALEAVLKNGLRELTNEGRADEMDSRVFRTAIEDVVKTIPEIAKVAGKPLTTETMQVLEKVGWAFHRLPVSLEPGTANRPSLGWEPGFSVTYGPGEHAMIGQFVRKIPLGASSSLAQRFLSPSPLAPLREARIEWAADSPPNPDWAGANPETRGWFNQYAKLSQELRVRTLEEGVGIGLHAASLLTREQLTELDQFVGGRPEEHESIVRKELGQVVDALNAKLAAHERPRLRGEIGRGRLQYPAPAVAGQPSETPAARGPAFGMGLLLFGGAFGTAAAVRKAA